MPDLGEIMDGTEAELADLERFPMQRLAGKEKFIFLDTLQAGEQSMFFAQGQCGFE